MNRTKQEITCVIMDKPKLLCQHAFSYIKKKRTQFEEKDIRDCNVMRWLILLSLSTKNITMETTVTDCTLVETVLKQTAK